MDMTSGQLPKQMLLFSLPLMFSNLLQILFNLADVAVVGRFAGSIALGAVGSTTYLLTLTTGILLGLGGGINAVTARCIGARDIDGERKCVHTAALLAAASGFLLVLAGLFLSGPVLRLMNTKDELFADARLYLTVYLLGSPALAAYNFGCGILSAAGDTERPLRYLSLAGVLNVALNLLFVLVFHLAVLGVALASILSQYVSAVLILRHLLTCGTDYGLKVTLLQLDALMAKRLLRLCVPASVQYSLFAIANLFIQSAVNSFDHTVVEGISAAANADNLVYDIMAAFYTAGTSFVAQNYGAGKPDRIRAAYRWSVIYSCAIALLFGALLLLFSEQFLRLFTVDTEILAYGRYRLTIMACSYWISAFMDAPAAAARGLGKSIAPTVIVILGSVVYRVIWVYTVFAYYHTMLSLYLVFSTAWTFTAIIANLYLFHAYRKLGIR